MYSICIPVIESAVLRFVAVNTVSLLAKPNRVVSIGLVFSGCAGLKHILNLL